MTAELKAQWIEALRSGNFEQGRKSLKHIPESSTAKPQYCCLGVLAELIGEVGNEPTPYRNCPLRSGDCYVFPDQLRERIGLPDAVHDEATCRNDGVVYDPKGSIEPAVPQTFAQIADWLEKVL